MRSLLTSSESDSSTTSLNTDSESSGEWFDDGAVYRSPKLTKSTPRSRSSNAIDPIVLEGSIPSAAEHQQVLASIQVCEQQAVKLNSKLDHLYERMQDTATARKDKFKRIRALRWSISALRRFPNEILGVIFEIYVLELQQSPWTLTRVCGRFRDAAFGTRKIWTRIRLVKHRRGMGRFSKGRERCTNVSHLQAALNRSGHALLDIKVSYITLDMAILLASECTRWGILKFTGPWRDEDKKVMPAFFAKSEAAGRIRSVHLPMLEDLQCLAEWLQWAKPASLKLSSFKPSTLAPISWWDELRDLRIHDRISLSSNQGNSLRSTLRDTAPRLTKLQIIARGIAVSSPLYFTELLELELEGIGDWWNFKCDSLTKFSLCVTREVPATIRAVYPRLSDLSIDPSSFPLPSKSIFAPNLDALNLYRAGTGKPGENFIWLNSDGTLSDMSPTHLQLNDCRMSSKSLLDTLRPYQGLVSLELKYCGLPATFFKAFGVRHSKKNPILCPRLRWMIVHFGYFVKRFEKKRYIEAFESTVALRKEIGQPLSKLFVEWPSFLGSKPQEFA